MKSHTVKICFIVLAFALLGFSPQAKAQTVSPFSIQQIAAELTSPEKIARFIFKNFAYETDRSQFGTEERWQSPEELATSKKGDCEDFALFASQVLRANGVSAFMVNVYGNNFAHTVTVFKENGSYHVIDGTQVKRFEASSLQQLFSKVYPHWNEAQLVGYSPNGNCGRVLKTFKK